jgi:Tfp pilus assembly protein PilF
MRELSQRRLVYFFACLATVLSAAPLQSQRSGQQPQAVSAELHGQVRIHNQPAPQGILVLLDAAPGMQNDLVGSGQMSRTMTDSAGRFVFDHVVVVQGQQEKFLVTIRTPGYRTATYVVDFGSSPRAFVNIDLQREIRSDALNIPPGGPADSISAKQPASGRAQEELARGQELLIEKHDPKSSIKNFKKVIEIEPQYSPVYVLLGAAYMQVREWGDAKLAFEKGTKLEPGNASAFLGIGAALNQQQDFSGAIKPLSRSLELNANSAEAHYELGRSFWGLQKWQDAEPHARKSLEINKEFAPAHVLMGNIYLRRRDANSALKEFQEYIRLDAQGEYAAAVHEMIDKIQKALGSTK